MSFITREGDLMGRLAGLNELRKHLTSPKRHGEKVRVHLGENWWAEMEVEQALRFVDRRQADILHWLQPDAAPTKAGPTHPLADAPASTSPVSTAAKNSTASSVLKSPRTAIEPLQVLSDMVSRLVEPSAGHAKGVEVTQDGEVLNEEGEPFMEIREPVAGSSTTSNPVITPNTSKTSLAVVPDDYWSPATVERRRRLRQQVLASDSDEENEAEEAEYDEEGQEESRTAGPPIGKTSSPLPKPREHPPIISTIPGRMVRSTVIDQDTQPQSILKESLPPSRPETPKKSVTFSPNSEVSDGAGTVNEVSTKKDDTHAELGHPNSFAGFARGFLTSAPNAIATPSNAMVLSSRSPSPKPPTVPTLQVNGEEVSSTSAVADIPPSRPAKKQSLFSQRKAQARAASVAPSKPVVDKQPINPVMQTAMHERVSEAPPVIKSIPSVVTATPGPSIPPAKKRESASDKVFKGRVIEQIPAPRAPASIAAVNVGPTPRNPAIVAAASTPSHDDDSDRELLEYSDAEDDAFDMDDAMLAREAALEYHAKRAEMGRKGLGGWTGGVREDGQVEWDRTGTNPYDADDDSHHSEIVGFGERVLPAGLLQNMTDASGGFDQDESISLPTVVPAGTLLGSAIRTGKLEDGRLVIPAGEDSDDSEADDPSNVDSAVVRAQREGRARKAETIRRMLAGDWRDLAAQEEKDRLADTISPGPIPDELPRIASTPSSRRIGKAPS